jgi:basic membrane protein A and related proteins
LKLISRRKFNSALTLQVVALTLGVASLGNRVVAAPFELKGEPKIAIIYTGTALDGGWNEVIGNASKVAGDELGVKIEYIDEIPEEKLAVKKAIDNLVKRGFNVIIGSSYAYSEGMLEKAKDHPEIAFLNISGSTNSSNLESFYARTYQGWYLAGMAAAGASKTKKIGIIAGYPISTVNWDVNAYVRGVRAIDPTIEVDVNFVSSWWDPIKEGKVAEEMLAKGIDVIGSNQSSAAPFTVIETRGAHVIGNQADMSSRAPKGHLTSVVYHWENLLVPTLKNIVAGTWTPSEYGVFASMADGVIAITPLGDAVPAEIKAKIESAKAMMAAGTLTPFDGPVLKQNGTEAVAMGKTPDDEAMWKMDYLVQGAIGTMPPAPY